MKKSLHLTLVILFCSLFSLSATAQNAPIWARNITDTIGTATMHPVRTLHDGNNAVFVLSNRLKMTEPAIYLKKYDEDGTLLWTLIYNNNTNGQPRGYDMAIDDTGNCYIAGAFEQGFTSKPLLMKVNTLGALVWLKDSITSSETGSLGTGSFDQIILKNKRIYAKGNGIAAFKLNGEEIWSNSNTAFRMAVDSKGEVIVTGSDTANNTVFRYDSIGNMNFSDSSVYYANSIAVDTKNDFYLLSASPEYELVKYSSTGERLWNLKNFPKGAPFGDIGYDILIDNDTNVIVVGLVDTMFKFSPNGKLIWKKPMNGLDGYLISAQITFNNLIAIAGTINVNNQSRLGVATFNLNGDQNWSGFYEGNIGNQEFTVDMSIDNSGIYVLENNDQNTTLVKFESPVFQNPINYNLVCVDSVWYRTSDNIQIRVFNGNTTIINYPSVQIISPTGDTISNPENTVTFFGQSGNSYQVYEYMITVAGITDFSDYTFLLSEGLKDTTVAITECNRTAGTTNIETTTISFAIYPNPFRNQFSIHTNAQTEDQMTLKLYDVLGREVLSRVIISGETIDREALPNGLYHYAIEHKNRTLKTGKLIAH